MTPDNATTSHWVHDLSPFLVQFTENIGIRYYGLAYLLGFAGGAWLLYLAAKSQRLKLPPVAVADLMTALIIGALLGGRLGYFLLYDLGSVLRNPLQLVQVWQGGMASHGGFVGVAVALIWFGRKHRISFWHLADAVVAVAPLGLALGRVANFINGELWGRVSSVRWAVIFHDSAAPGTPLHEIAARHPSQIYQAVLEGFLLLAFTQWRFWRTGAVAKSPGRLSGEFLVAYAVVRSVGEIFREPDAGLIMGLSRGTFYSLFMVVIGLVIIRRSNAPIRA